LSHPHPPAAVRRLLASLSGRYLLGALLLLILLAGSAWIASAYLESERRTRADHLRQRQAAQAQLQIIRSALWTAEHNLHAYSLKPRPEYRLQALRAIRNGQGQAGELAALPWSRRNGQRQRARQLAADFDRLQQAAVELIAVRNDRERLYPALTYLRDPLGPANRSFLEEAQQALAALAQQDHPASARARTLFQQARYQWSRMVGEFRLFLAARIGVLGNSQDSSRQANLESYHAEVATTLGELQTLHDRKGLGLTAERALRRMQEREATWFQAYQRVARLYTTRNWRADFPLITGTLYPQYETIQGRLHKLQEAMQRTAHAEMSGLSRAARNIAVFPWALVGLHLVVVTAGFLYLRRGVLAPLSRLARALRREAEGKPAALAIAGGASEIQDLSQAFRRMREEVRARQGDLEHQAFHDPLTALPNRALLEDRLDQAILRSRRAGTGGALMMVDLDFFKEINDTFGHPTGDGVLQVIAERMVAELRESDTVARFGGDEFGILLPGASGDQAMEAADRLLTGLRPRVEVGDHSFHISASIGIVLFPDHGEEAETLIRRADVAMYQAKDKRQGPALFEPDQDNRSSAQLTGTAELYDDILQDRIPLHFQPQWPPAAATPTGGEALLRWGPHDGSAIAPPEVLAMAQRAGILHLLSRRIINAAMREAASWQGSGPRQLAINLTTEDLQSQDLPAFIRQQLEAWELPPETLELEITENDMMADPERARRVLGELRALGVRIAIDDYGTGYSSLAYLRGLPVDVLKIDKSFVMSLATDADNQAIVRSTVELGQNLNLEVVAEGVEDAESLALLRDWGCDRAQGYYLGHPADAASFRTELTATPPRPAR
jgi:diguanylate cyclase (GGDEF)-like protein